MSRAIPRNQTITDGPIEVTLGRREFDSIHEAAALYPRQSFNIDPDVLKANGYGQEQIRRLLEGFAVTYCDYKLVPSGENILEFPDGSRYVTNVEFLGNNRIAKTIIRRLPDAPR